ncbi:MAG TPA: xanthine dehydrogenase family protein subunit M [Candidatus Binatia bacterium]|nr:xanthine dehydrogenase family protein subunit M [Candidatus Binatia bacterium]
MKPPAFDYVVARTVDEAVEQLNKRGGGAKILAGGQSLTPMLNFRLVHPEALVDINRIAGLNHITPQNGGVRIGALTRHRTIEESPVIREKLPVVAAAAAEVGHLAIRNRGTFGGSLAHADPAAEFPIVALALDATITTKNAKGGRTIKAKDFFVSYLQSAVEEGEIVTEVTLPGLPAKTGWGFEELCRRPGDFAIAAVCALVTFDGSTVKEARIAMGGVGPTALRAPAAEALLKGQALNEDTLKAAGEKAAEASDPSNDVHASADFRRHLVSVLTKRALQAAEKRAAGR